MVNDFKSFFTNNLVSEAEIKQKLDNFQGIVNDNADLKNAIELCSRIEQLEPNAEAIVVGGSVRDILLNKKPKDIDIATNVDIEKIAKAFRTADIGKSKDFGIVSVQYNGGIYEVAHYREDVYQGNTNSRHPSSVNLSNTFELDSERRDITINSLGLTTDGTIIDYQGGLQDLRAGIIRAVGKPKDRFIEDALRMMRIGRFMSRYGFKLDEDTKNAIIELKDLIMKVSPERIRDELFKAASSGAALANYIEHLKEVGLLKLILPEIDIMSNYEHDPEHHPEGNVFIHTLEALKKSRLDDPLANMALMFHDLGKPVSHHYDPIKDKMRYQGHDKQGVDVLTIIANRLKFSNDQKEAIKFAIEFHMVGHDMSNMKTSKILALRQNKNWEILKNVLYSDDAARQHLFNPDKYEKRMQKVEDTVKRFGEKEAFEQKMSAIVDGKLIISLIPRIKGKDIGIIKDQAREWVISKEFNVDKKEVAQFIKNCATTLGY